MQYIIFWGLLLTGYVSCAQSVNIIYPENASTIDRLGAQEARKYIYQRTGLLLDINHKTLNKEGANILIAPLHSKLIQPYLSRLNQTLKEGQFMIKSLTMADHSVLVITGYDSLSTLYGVYRFAEHLGIGFDLAGDIIPDHKIALDLMGYDEVGTPLFETRGIQPFHDFFQGPDLWSTADYQSIITQLPKLGMNFIGLHTYPKYSTTYDLNDSVPQGPEPTVWIGLPEFIEEDGRVKWSYPAYYAHTHRPNRIWGYARLRTDHFHAGASQVFSSNEFGSDVFSSGIPNDVESSNRVFNKVGEMFSHAFTHAKNLGVKTAVGTELPMGLEPQGPEVDFDWIRVMPVELQKRLQEMGKDPGDPTVVKEVYKGIFTRIMKTHPLDYYWLWSWEVWGMHGVSEKQIDSFKQDISLAQEALQELGNPFQIGLAAWRTGSVENPVAFDEVLPPEAPFFSLWDEAEGLDKLQDDRVKWAATWPEEDWGLIQPQLELHRIFNDAEAGFKINARGFIGKHWRTRVLGANHASMKSLSWTYTESGETAIPSIPTNKNEWIDAFYLDWCERNFGSEAAAPIAKIFSSLDLAGEPGEEGAIPVVSEWETDIEDSGNGAPGAVFANDETWEDVAVRFEFVSELEKIRPIVEGAGNLYRFDYWLKTMQHFQLLARYGTLRNDFESAMGDKEWQKALDYRIQLARMMEQILTLEIEKIVNISDIGTILAMEILNWHQLMELKWDEKLREGLETGLPATAYPGKNYHGESFIRVIQARSQLYQGEDLNLKVLMMGDLQDPVLHWRYLGETEYKTLPISEGSRSVYRVTIPAPNRDFEYYLSSRSDQGSSIVFPVSAPSLNRVVLVIDQ